MVFDVDDVAKFTRAGAFLVLVESIKVDLDDAPKFTVALVALIFIFLNGCGGARSDDGLFSGGTLVSVDELS